MTAPRSDNPPAELPEFPAPALAAGAALALSAGAVAVAQRSRRDGQPREPELV